jgi:hypothetical protein
VALLLHHCLYLNQLYYLYLSSSNYSPYLYFLYANYCKFINLQTYYNEKFLKKFLQVILLCTIYFQITMFVIYDHKFQISSENLGHFIINKKKIHLLWIWGWEGTVGTYSKYYPSLIWLYQQNQIKESSCILPRIKNITLKLSLKNYAKVTNPVAMAVTLKLNTKHLHFR